VQRRGRNQIATVQDDHSAARLGVGDRRREMAAVVVGVGDQADFHGGGIVSGLPLPGIYDAYARGGGNNRLLFFPERGRVIFRLI
jgi:hypothetical protein